MGSSDFGSVARLDGLCRRDFIKVIGASIAVGPLSARAQQPDRVRRIGVLHQIPEQDSPGFKAFRKKLGELGHVVGQNTIIEYRSSHEAQRLAALAVELGCAQIL